MHLPDDLKDSVLSIFEASLEAQLRAVRRLRAGSPDPATPRSRASLSQVDMAFDILKKARAPSFHLTVDRNKFSYARWTFGNRCSKNCCKWMPYRIAPALQ